MVTPLLVERLMCHGDGMDCLADGRKNAYKYFKKLAANTPGMAGYTTLCHDADSAE